MVAGASAGSSFTSSLRSKVQRMLDEVLMCLLQPRLLEVLDTRRTFAVEFSKTGPPVRRRKKASDARARGLRGIESYRNESAWEAPEVE